MKCYFEHFVITRFQCLHQHLRCPNLTFLRFCLGHGCIHCRILFHQIPFYSLTKSTPQYLMNFIYRGFCNRTGSVHILGTLYCRHFQKILIILFHEMRIDTGELYFADCRQYVIIYQTDISSISRNTPFIMSVNLYILFKEFFQNRAFGNLEFPDGYFILYFFFPFFSILLC